MAANLLIDLGILPEEKKEKKFIENFNPFSVVSNEDAEYESVSAATLESFLPVQIENEELKDEFEAVFYPSKRKPKQINAEGKVVKTRKVVLAHPLHYPMLAKYLTQVSAYVNAMFTHLRYIATNSNYFTIQGKEFSSVVIGNHARNLKTKITEEAITAHMKGFLETVGEGKSHIIKPSNRFKNGYDVIYSGLPSQHRGKSSAVSVTETKEGWPAPVNTNSLEYKTAIEPGGMYYGEYSDKAREVAKLLLKALLGTEDTVKVSNSFKRKMADRELTSQGLKTAIEKVVLSSQEASLFLGDFLVDFPVLDPEVAFGLTKYISMLVISEASDQAVFSMRRSEDTAPDQLPVAHQALELEPNLGFSIVAHIPKEIAQYISQAKADEPVKLSSLNIWAAVWSRVLLRAPKARQQGSAGTGRITIGGIPRYILSPSSIATVAKRRKELGLYSEKGKTNEDSIYISNTGTFNFCPTADDLVLDNAVKYEALVEEATALSFEAGSPLNASQTGSTSPVFDLASKIYAEKIASLKAEIRKYAGTFQGYSWDYNCILVASQSDPDKLVAVRLEGSATPDSLAVASYLSEPFAKSMALQFRGSSTSGSSAAEAKAIDENTIAENRNLLSINPYRNALNLYAYLLAEKLVPTFSDLLAAAAKEKGLKSLEDDPHEIKIYNRIITNDLEIRNKDMNNFSLGQDAYMANINAINGMLEAVLIDSSGRPGSNCAVNAAKEQKEIQDSEYYFNAAFYQMAEFKNVYNYLGGKVFQLAMQALASVDKKKLLLHNTENPCPSVNFQSIVKEVMPFVMMMCKYVPNSEAIIREANDLAEKNKRNESITQDDIHVPGSKESSDTSRGFEVFPHQLQAHQYLRNAPKFAVLDIAPGGGKTILGLSDIASLIHDGLIKRPLVIAPNGLVKNWVEDMHKVTEGKWNCIPITTQVYNSPNWGDEKLTELLKSAPINTITVVGLSVLRIQRYPVVIGNHVEQVTQVLEFIKKFGFDYVLIDEAHKTKNVRRMAHKVCKQITTSSSVKYVRLATGTLIHNKVTDVVGQAALFNSQIFRTVEEFEADNMQVKEGTLRVMEWRRDTPERARRQLARHSAVISLKRKEWAFMLPVPIEKFIPVRLEKTEEEGGNAHQLMYDAILEETLANIEKDLAIRSILEGREDGEGGDEGEENEDGEEGGEDSGEDLDDATMMELEAKLEPYLARLDQMLVDPLGDEFGEIYFKGLRKEDFVSNKIKKVIERIDLHYADFPWEKGKEYKIKDVCDVGDQRYVLMPPDDVKPTEVDYSVPYEAKISPDKDPRWKPESRGKILVFCRYIRSVDAIYRALPAKYRKIAVKFHSNVKDRAEGFHAFQSTPVSKDKGVQIFIANEQAISEGYNLQVASRMIRVEAPWTPGELDQTVSRLFRPDPSGKFSRENVYLDWILVNNSIEVAKMGRLISKMLQKAQFDEEGNPLYENINPNQLEPIRMSIKYTLRHLKTLDQISEYTEAYQNLASIQGKEFKEMRLTRPSTMLPVESTPMMDKAKILDFVPYLPNQDVPDRKNLGLVKLSDFLQDVDDPDVKAVLRDKSNLVGKIVHTELGNGIIVGVGLTRKPADGQESSRQLTSVNVQIPNQDEPIRFSVSMVYLANNLTEKDIKIHAPNKKWRSKKEQREAERLEAAAQREAEREARKKEKARLREERELERLRRLEELRKQQTGSGGRRGPKPPQEEELNNNIEIYPVVYNGFLAIEAKPEDDDIDMKTYGFRKFGTYAFTQIKNYVAFTGVLDFLELHFDIPTSIARTLDKLHDTFESGRTRKFNVEIAPQAEFKNFYTLRHQLAKVHPKTKVPEIKVYPVVINGYLYLNIDLATNPAFKRFLNKPIPNSNNTKFEEADGIYIQFFDRQTELKKKVTELKKAGFEITNHEELNTTLEQLQTLLKKRK